MNDENKNNPDLEETENFDDFEDAFEDDFTLEETSEGESTTPPSSPKTATSAAEPRPSKKNGSPLPIVIGIAVFCFFGWKLFQHFGSSSKKTVAEEQPAVAIATPAVEPITEPVLKPVLQEKVVVLPPPEPSVESQLATHDKQYQEKIQLLEKEFALVQQNAQSTSRAVEGLSHDLFVLTTAIQQLSEQVDNLRENQEREILRKEQTKSVAKPKRSASHSVDQLPSLTVYAIIPGRAWLRSPNGKTLTVTEGDTLAEFGKVLKIDASNGVVITTSGVTLR